MHLFFVGRHLTKCDTINVHLIKFGKITTRVHGTAEIIDHFGSLNLSMMNKVVLLLGKLDLDVASINTGPPVDL